MKGKKCFGLLLALSIIFGLSLNVYSDVNAYNYKNAGTAPLDGSRSVLGSTVGTVSGADNGGGTIVFQKPGNFGRISYLTLCSSQIVPNNSLIYFTYQYVTAQTTYPLLQITTNSYDYSTMTNNYGEYGTVTTSFYTDSRTSDGCFWFRLAGDGALYTQPATLYISNMNWVELENGASADQIYGIAQTLTSFGSKFDVINNNIEKILEEIKSQDGDGAQDRQNIEDQQTDIDDSSGDSASDAQSTGTTLLGAFTGFVGALTSATPSNCNIDMDLGNLDLGIVNLCQLSLPQPFPTIASIMLILFCVPLSIATARKVINLFRSFQG